MSIAIYPIPRNSLIWLLVTVCLALLPHSPRLPEWMWVTVAVALLWRIQVFRQRWAFPNKILRIAFVFGGSAAIFYYYGTLLGPEAGVALLVLAYTFKLLEMYRERDAYLIVILSFFVLATNYLFERGFLSTLYSLFVSVVITASLVGLNQNRLNSDFKRTFKIGARLMVHSVPLMLILFVLVPRIGPLWSMNLDTTKAKTGISDRMTPGDISELSKSSELAFRAEVLNGNIPHNQDLYWRGAVFSHFDGRTWSVDKSKFKKNVYRDLDQAIVYDKEDPHRFNYKIFLEPTNQEWLFSIPYGQVQSRDFTISDNLTWFRKERITNSLSYEVTSFLNYRNSTDYLHPLDKVESLQLPPSGDLRSRSWAIDAYRSVGSDPSRFVEFILSYFHKESFSYTLNPTPLQNNTIDQFLFATRNGFCTHYAGAFVFLMRSVGIPARMVGGYQGGEVHESGRYITVRQYSAHAWAEAWIDGEGWVRYDPTASVAPDRIFDGVEGLLSNEEFLSNSPLNPANLRNWPVLSQIRSSLEHLDYLWTKWVVGYNTTTQSQFLSRFLGNVTPEKIAYMLAIIGGGCVFFFALLLVSDRPKNKLDPVDKLYAKYCQKLSKKGIRRGVGEAPYDFAKRISQEVPGIAVEVNRIAAIYVKIKYGKASLDTEINGIGTKNRGRLGPLYYQLKQEIRTLKV